MTTSRSWCLYFCFFVLVSTGAFSKRDNCSIDEFKGPAAGERNLIVISDLHFGLGCNGTVKNCASTEDFRWTKALSGFLDQISKDSNDRADLIIAGDFLELWQRPDSIQCEGSINDLGCTVKEIEDTTNVVVSAHAKDLAALSAFSQRGDNRLYVIPGNHDSALLLPSVWSILADKLGTKSGRVNLSTCGILNHQDRRILIEHGHQIGADVNGFKKWPGVTGKDAAGRLMLIRTWGEKFVQDIFNKEEPTYPIIDNLSPETAGVAYRMGDRGLIDSARDVAKFIAFNLFETSFNQKEAALGKEAPDRTWDAEAARKLGYKLYTGGLPKGSKLRILVEQKTPNAIAVQGELNRLAKQLKDPEVNLLCDKLFERGAAEGCARPQTGALLEGLVPKARVMSAHITDRLSKYPDTEIFVYGHTHQVEREWSVTAKNRKIRVLNTGAFQRLVSDPDYVELVMSLNMTPEQGLRTVRLEQLAPCYTGVRIKTLDDALVASTFVWRMSEKGGQGEFDPQDAKACKPSKQDQ